MSKVPILLLVLLAFVLASCSMQPPAPAPAPEAAPTTEASGDVAPTTEAAGGEAAQLPATPAANLLGSWQWTSFSDPANGPADIANPENYILNFNDDGAVMVKADCNNAQGSYTADDSSLSIQLGPTTMVYCGDESSSDDFLKHLGFAAIYSFLDGNLLIDLMADGGTMTFTSAGGGAQSTSGDLPDDVVAQLDAFLQAQVYKEGTDPATAAPGVILLVDTPDGHYLNTAGVASMEDSTPMKPDDHLEIGSNTKSFTIVLLMQLQEAGVLSLDDPLSKWLPGWAEKIPNGDQMTLHQLAQHTTGIWDYADDIIGAGTEDPDKLVQGYTPEELVQYAIDNGTPDFTPGEKGKWKYSNTGYILLGMVIEKAAGKPLGDLYQERIFDPLGMKTAALIEGVPKDEEITTNGYWWNDDGTMLNTTNWNVSQGWAAGGLAMNAEDLLTYAKALSAGELFKDPNSLKEMLTFDPNGMDGMMPYGLGLIDFSKAGAAEGYWGHEGQTTGFQTLWYTNPDTGITVIGLTNSATFSAWAFLEVMKLPGLESN